MKERKEGRKKEFLKKGLLIGFGIMVVTMPISLLANFLPSGLVVISGVLSYISVLWTFIFSIINLVKFEKKTFAIVALVMASLIILMIVFSFGLIMGYAAAKAGVTF